MSRTVNIIPVQFPDLQGDFRSLGSQPRFTTTGEIKKFSPLVPTSDGKWKVPANSARTPWYAASNSAAGSGSVTITELPYVRIYPSAKSANISEAQGHLTDQNFQRLYQGSDAQWNSSVISTAQIIDGEITFLEEYASHRGRTGSLLLSNTYDGNEGYDVGVRLQDGKAIPNISGQQTGYSMAIPISGAGSVDSSGGPMYEIKQDTKIYEYPSKPYIYYAPINHLFIDDSGQQHTPLYVFRDPTEMTLEKLQEYYAAYGNESSVAFCISRTMNSSVTSSQNLWEEPFINPPAGKTDLYNWEHTYVEPLCGWSPTDCGAVLNFSIAAEINSPYLPGVTYLVYTRYGVIPCDNPVQTEVTGLPNWLGRQSQLVSVQWYNKNLVGDKLYANAVSVTGKTVNCGVKRNKGAAMVGWGTACMTTDRSKKDPRYPVEWTNCKRVWIKNVAGAEVVMSDGGLSESRLKRTDYAPGYYIDVMSFTKTGTYYSGLDRNALLYPTYYSVPTIEQIHALKYNAIADESGDHFREYDVWTGASNIWSGLLVGELMPYDVRPHNLKIANVGATSPHFTTSFMAKYCADYTPSAGPVLTKGTCTATKQGAFTLNNTYLTFDDSIEFNVALNSRMVYDQVAYVTLKHKPTGKYVTYGNELVDAPVAYQSSLSSPWQNPYMGDYSTRGIWNATFPLKHLAFAAGELEYDLTCIWNYPSREAACDSSFYSLHTRTANFKGTI